MRKVSKFNWKKAKSYEKVFNLYGGLMLAFGLFFITSMLLLTSQLGFPLRQCVGIAYIKGEITVDGTRPTLIDEGSAGSEEIAERIRNLNKRPDIKAVVFVIDSPGGSVVASKEIYNAIMDLSKPKVAYIREIGTSGAYLVSLAADEIVANPDSLTGSIGVISIIMNYKELANKLGINVTTIKTGQHKDFFSPTKEVDEEEIAIMQSIINETFKEFVDLVKERRKGKLKLYKINEITDGRIFSGRQAYKLGLVDVLGDKDKAIDEAKKLAKDENLDVCEIDLSGNSPPSLFSGIFNLFRPLYESRVGIYLK